MREIKDASLGAAMSRSRFVVACIAGSLISIIPASAEEPISLRDLGSFHVGVVDIFGKADKQALFIGGVSIRVDSSGHYEVEQTHFLPQTENDARPRRHGNLIGVTPDGSQIFCFCGATTF
ncbi:hypothetical protein [Bradyrhizobium sp. 2S1]|uniref:hypothetical protein n=1 Tax=Bradyrhizobium sp. 2S1 TaxID=1404429 RepID=UPI00140BC95D|nr:hypothetical protein [Bradyrhizobium sp. 2S1]MCK7666322.1 hypothetical protein [Bradyrhizobium sp. 2S1]